MTRFVILSAPRSGSNMLCSLLHSHPDILCHHELYNPNGIFYALDLRGKDFSLAGMDMPLRDEQPLEFLKQIWQHDLGFKWVGFKMTHYQNPGVFNALLNEKSILKIILKRKQKLARHVSRLIAEKRNVWEDYGDQPKKDHNTKVHVDFAELKKDIAFNHSFYQEINEKLLQTGQTAFYINYEELKIQKKLNNLLDFLGCQNLMLTTKSKKQNSERLSELIANYEELKTELAGTSIIEELLNC